MEQISEMAFAHALRLSQLSPRAASLEQAYMELTASSVEYAATEPDPSEAAGLTSTDRNQGGAS